MDTRNLHPDYRKLNSFERKVYHELLMTAPQRALTYLYDTLTFRGYNDEVAFGGYVLNIMDNTLTYRGKTIKLRPTWAKVLEYVIVTQSKGETVYMRDMSQWVYNNSLSEPLLRPHLTWMKQHLPDFKSAVIKTKNGDRRAVYTLGATK